MTFPIDSLGYAGLISVLIAAVAACYLFFALVRTLSFLPRPIQTAGDAPTVSIFKPVRGTNERLYDNLKSYCLQDYPRFQVIFGVCEPSDPALPVIRRLVAEFPDLDIKISIGSDDSACNPKVATLLPMVAFADFDIWVVADSDTRANRELLTAIVHDFAAQDVGAVTCLYTADARKRIVPRFGAMAINEWFLPSVLVAETIGPLKFCFGATMAIRRKVLDEIGGFQVLADNLADDYMLGQLVHRSGYRVALARALVETEVPDQTLTSLLSLELRWARTIRAVQPAGYLGSFLTYSIPLSLIAVALTSASALSLILLCLVLVLRFGIHFAVRRFVGAHDPAVLWLIPLRDCFGFFIWVAGFARRTVVWRGERYRVENGGRMKLLGKR
jgi:ceramide glucosyltransferase